MAEPTELPPVVDEEDDESGYRRRSIQQAATMLACPYRRRGEKCETGCWEEPVCVVDEPEGGWASVLNQAECEEPGSVAAAFNAVPQPESARSIRAQVPPDILALLSGWALRIAEYKLAVGEPEASDKAMFMYAVLTPENDAEVQHG